MIMVSPRIPQQSCELCERECFAVCAALLRETIEQQSDCAAWIDSNRLPSRPFFSMLSPSDQQSLWLSIITGFRGKITLLASQKWSLLWMKTDFSGQQQKSHQRSKLLPRRFPSLRARINRFLVSVSRFLYLSKTQTAPSDRPQSSSLDGPSEIINESSGRLCD